MAKYKSIREDFQERVKTFIGETGITISQIADKVGYSAYSRLRKYVYKNEGALTDVTMDKILKFIHEYKG